MTKQLYVLRTNKNDGTSRNDFRWPQEVGGVATAPDWEPTEECGNGLHGALWGVGNGHLLSWVPDAQWMVVGILPADTGEADVVEGRDYIDLGGKVKFSRGMVAYVGDRKGATDLLTDLASKAGVQTPDMIGAARLVGDGRAVSVGYGGQATAGNYGTATAGHRGTATAGDGGSATAGHRGRATAGDRGTATAGDGGSATAGYDGTATAGNYGAATAGYDGTATTGNYGSATAGDRGTATAGDGGTATAGDRGIIQIKHWDDAARRYRLKVGYIVETPDKEGNPLEANRAYKLESEEFVKVT